MNKTRKDEEAAQSFVFYHHNHRYDHHDDHNHHYDGHDSHGDHHDGHGTGTLPVQERVKQVSKEVVGDAGAELPTWGRFPGSCQQLAIQVHHLEIGDL